MKLKTKFQDEDFDLGEVVEADIYVFHGGDNKLKVEACAAKGGYHTFYLDSLKELNDMFEDYEEPDEIWYIDWKGDIRSADIGNKWEREKAIGNYFLSKEEAERAAEKLKAWKRLKDKGFRFIDHIDRDCGQGMTRYEWDGYIDGEDLDLLFSQEDD